MDIQAAAQTEVLQDLLSTLQEHDGVRVTPGKREPKVEVKARVEEDLPAHDADERLLKLLQGK